MNRFDKDIKWQLVDLMGQLGGSKSGLFRCAITDESLWVFWARKVQVRLRSESGHLGLWYFVELEKERGGGLSAIINLTNEGIFRVSLAASSVHQVEMLDLVEKVEVVEYLRNVLKQQLETE
jgi:hypothetical protein